MATTEWNAGELFKAFNLSDAERALVTQATDPSRPQGAARAKAISELVLAKSIEDAAQRVVNSNETLSRSNDKYSARMVWLTAALVFVGAVQIFVSIVQLLK